jgi:hypothetical protein
MMQENVPTVVTRNTHVKTVSSYMDTQIGGMIYRPVKVAMELVLLGVQAKLRLLLLLSLTFLSYNQFQHPLRLLPT